MGHRERSYEPTAEESESARQVADLRALREATGPNAVLLTRFRKDDPATVNQTYVDGITEAEQFILEIEGIESLAAFRLPLPAGPTNVLGTWEINGSMWNAQGHAPR